MAQCITPYHVRNKKPYGFNQTNWLPVPCGKCPICLARRSEGWIFRLKQQQKVSTNFNFITLTYNDENLPRTNNGLATLKRSDLTNFFKRLRKLHGKSQTLKYYACGEYGSTFRRPHYHIILFNANPKYVALAWKLQGKDIGHVDVGDTTRGAIAYVTGYVMKGKVVPEHSRDDREKEYSVMSKDLEVIISTSELKDTITPIRLIASLLNLVVKKSQCLAITKTSFIRMRTVLVRRALSAKKDRRMS